MFVFQQTLKQKKPENQPVKPEEQKFDLKQKVTPTRENNYSYAYQQDKKSGEWNTVISVNAAAVGTGFSFWEWFKTPINVPMETLGALFNSNWLAAGVGGMSIAAGITGGRMTYNFIARGRIGKSEMKKIVARLKNPTLKSASAYEDAGKAVVELFYKRKIDEAFENMNKPEGMARRNILEIEMPETQAPAMDVEAQLKSKIKIIQDGVRKTYPEFKFDFVQIKAIGSDKRLKLVDRLSKINDNMVDQVEAYVRKNVEVPLEVQRASSGLKTLGVNEEKIAKEFDRLMRKEIAGKTVTISQQRVEALVWEAVYNKMNPEIRQQFGTLEAFNAAMKEVKLAAGELKAQGRWFEGAKSGPEWFQKYTGKLSRWGPKIVAVLVGMTIMYATTKIANNVFYGSNDNVRDRTHETGRNGRRQGQIPEQLSEQRTNSINQAYLGMAQNYVSGVSLVNDPSGWQYGYYLFDRKDPIALNEKKSIDIHCPSEQSVSVSVELVPRDYPQQQINNTKDGFPSIALKYQNNERIISSNTYAGRKEAKAAEGEVYTAQCEAAMNNGVPGAYVTMLNSAGAPVTTRKFIPIPANAREMRFPEDFALRTVVIIREKNGGL